MLLLRRCRRGGDGPIHGSAASLVARHVDRRRISRNFEEQRSWVNLQTGFSLNSSTMFRAGVGAPGLWRGSAAGRRGRRSGSRRTGCRFTERAGIRQPMIRQLYDFSPKPLVGRSTPRSDRGATCRSVGGATSFRHISTTLDVAALPPRRGGPGHRSRSDLSDSARGRRSLIGGPSPGYSTRGGFYRASRADRRAQGVRPFSFDLAGVRGGQATGAGAARTVCVRLPRPRRPRPPRQRPRGAGHAGAVSGQRQRRCVASPTAVSPIAIACCSPANIGGGHRATSTWRCLSTRAGRAGSAPVRRPRV